MLDFRVWFQGLLAAGITGGAHSVTNYLVDPTLLDSHAGMIKLAKIVGMSIIISIAAYLYKSPLPAQASTIDYTKLTKEQLDALVKQVNTEVASRTSTATATTTA